MSVTAIYTDRETGSGGVLDFSLSLCLCLCLGLSFPRVILTMIKLRLITRGNKM
jgi:hypothetical protein